MSGAKSAATNATEGTSRTDSSNSVLLKCIQNVATNATEGTENATEGPIETGKNFVDQIWGQITNLFK